ncbi:MAG: hypothetical protein FWH04_02145 [Oscillospiraceae bacterium]|nr:hypothetical protein [Oscillospiraceae bacterium]
MAAYPTNGYETKSPWPCADKKPQKHPAVLLVCPKAAGRLLDIYFAGHARTAGGWAATGDGDGLCCLSN